MASCQTTRWTSTAPYVKLTVTSNNVDGDTARLSWELQYISDYAAETSVAKSYTVKLAGETVKSGTYSIDGKKGTYTIAGGTKDVARSTSAQSVSFSVSFGFNLTWSDVYKGTLSASGSVSVAAKTSYAIKYNANGGSGAPSEQTKWYGTAITLSSTKPTRTGYAFQGWATSASGSVAYSAGASYTANAAVTLYAVWKANTYTVSYDANGGSGAPGAQTKTYGQTLKLTTSKPTRTNYNFLGWSTAKSAATAAYSADGDFTTNANTTLYAVWELAYIKPRITELSVERCDASGTVSDDGTYGLITFKWECYKELADMMILWDSSLNDGSEETLSDIVRDGGTSGTVRHVFSSGQLSAEATYSVSVYVEDASGYTYALTTLYGTQYAIDFKAGGKGAAFGKPAELDGVLDIAYKTRMDGGILPPILPPEADLDAVLTPNTYVGYNVAQYNYANCPVTNGTFILRVESCGDAGQVKQTFIVCSKYRPEVYSRFYYQGKWGQWWYASTDEVVLYESSSGSNGTINFQLGNDATDKPSASNYRYIEIYFTDNNGKTGGYTKVWNPNGKTVCLSIAEPGANIYRRQTMYAISGATMTPDVETASYIRTTGAGVVSTSIGTNYIKIVRVIGRA